MGSEQAPSGGSNLGCLWMLAFVVAEACLAYWALNVGVNNRYGSDRGFLVGLLALEGAVLVPIAWGAVVWGTVRARLIAIGCAAAMVAIAGWISAVHYAFEDIPANRASELDRQIDAATTFLFVGGPAWILLIGLIIAWRSSRD